MTPIYQSRQRAEAVAERLKVYAQPQRLMILSRLLDGERPVSDIERDTGIGQPALSQQLAELRRAELVQARRMAKQVFYRLTGEDVAVCVRSMEALLGQAVGNGRAPKRSAAPSAAPAARLPTAPGAATFAKLL